MQDADKKYSFRDFTGHDLTAERDLSGIIIEGSCFSRELPDSKVFPDAMVGTTFIDCNLDNVFIPPGNHVQGGTQKRFKVQNDHNDWIVDSHDVPVKIIDYDVFIKFSLSPPKVQDIPDQKAEERIDHFKIAMDAKNGGG